MRALALALAVVAGLVPCGAALASGGGGGGGAKGEAPAEEYFTFKELRVPLSDSDPVKIMTVHLMVLMDGPESKAELRSKQKELEHGLSDELAKVPTQTASKPTAPNDIKKLVAQYLGKAKVRGVKDVLLKKYLVW